MSVSVSGAQAQYALVSDADALYEMHLGKPEDRQPVVGVPAPYKVVISEDQRAAYAIQSTPGKVFGIDLITGEVTDIAAISGSPFGFLTDIKVAPDQRTAYVVDFGSSAIHVVDLITSEVTGVITGIAGPHAMAITRDGASAWVTSSSDGSIVKLDLVQHTLAQQWPVTAPVEILLAPAGDAAFVTDSLAAPMLTRINLLTGASTANDYGIKPAQMVLNSDGTSLLATGYSAKIVRVELATGNLIASADLPGTAPPDMATRPVSVAITGEGGGVRVGFGADILFFGPDLTPAGGPVSGFGNARVLALEPKSWTQDVIFLGDSVTAGFGYCGPADVGYAVGCGTNSEFSNAWVAGTFPLSHCAPPDPPAPPTNFCSNNNYDGNARPWTAPGGQSFGGSSPSIAYPFVIAETEGQSLALGSAAKVQNWAVTGATPAHWDPGSQDMGTEKGIYGDQLATIQNSHVVMTLGANPILSTYINVGIQITGFPTLTKGVCADSTIIDGKATSLDDEPAHVGDADGVGVCLSDQWLINQQDGHLLSIYRKLLDNGNRVIVMGYPPVCPWAFGNWQTAPNVVNGPASGNPCDTQIKPAYNPNMPDTTISQADQAFYLADLANGKIAGLVRQMNDPDIIFVPAPADWKDHQAWMQVPWIFKNDTWVHPNAQGHKQLSVGVVTALCEAYGHWCRNTDGYPTWFLPREL